MRTWLSKSKGYVTEKPNDCFTGVFTNSGEKIYEGDTINVTKVIHQYIGKYSANGWSYISEKERLNPKNWKTIEKHYTGKVYYLWGRFYIDMPTETPVISTLYGAVPRIEIYHGMTDKTWYGHYNIELC